MSQVFVIQARHLSDLALSATRQFFRLPEKLQSGNVWRIPVANNFTLPEHMYAELTDASCDFATLADIPFSHIKLLVSDMDSTLISIECIDEIAAYAGLKDRVAYITERAMRGELDFEQSLRQRVALLKGQPESVLQTVYEHALQLNDGAEYLLQQCQQYNIRFVLVSGGFTFFTNQLKKRLNFSDAFANQFEIENGKLTGRVLGRIIDAQTKKEILKHYQSIMNCGAQQTIAIGDGANDIPMLHAADFGIAFRAKPKTQTSVSLRINHNGLEAVRGWFG